VKKHVTKTDTQIPVIHLPFPFPLHSIRWRHDRNWHEVCVSHTVAPPTSRARATGCPGYSAQNNIHWKCSGCPHENSEAECFTPIKLCLRCWQSLSCSRNSLYFIELKGLLQCWDTPHNSILVHMNPVENYSSVHELQYQVIDTEQQAGSPLYSTYYPRGPRDSMSLLPMFQGLLPHW
jgi:hypothetical protein